MGSNSVAAGDPANEGDKLPRRVRLAPGPAWRFTVRIYHAVVRPQGAARDGRCAPCSPVSSKIHGVGVRLSPGT